MDAKPTWHTASHVGRRRVNADAVAAAGGTAALADGIGDDPTAAQAALTATTAAVSVPPTAGPAAALTAANKALEAGDCVLVVAQPTPTGYRIGWVGDARAYAWTGDELRQLTHDHTLAQYFLDHGTRPTPRMAHVVTATVHKTPATQYGTTETTASCLLLATDGLHRALTHQTMTSIMRHAPDPAAALVRAAHLSGATDNATALVLTHAHAASAYVPPTLPVPVAA